MKKLVLASGGVDSTTALAMCVDEFGKENVVALSMYYGQKHNKELEAVRKIVDYYDVKYTELDLSFIFKGSNCSLLKHSDAEIPKESYAEQLKDGNGAPVSTYVPFRNGLFISVAASIAIAEGCDEIYYGAHSDDAAGAAYPDCSPSFNNAMAEAIYEGSGKSVRLKAPFVNMTKADIVAEGLRLNVPYELTWSCYEGKDRPCGKCGTCVDRKKAFELNGKEDPLYE